MALGGQSASAVCLRSLSAREPESLCVRAAEALEACQGARG